MAGEQPTKLKHNWRFKDRTGERFGMLVFLEFSHTSHSKNTMWRCRCDCGTEIIASVKNIVHGKQVSCGCYRKAINRKIHETHGMAAVWKRRPEYVAWQHAKDRCHNPRNKNYPEWGGRGITMSEEWRNSFEAFYRDMGPRPPGTSLDRIKNELGYSKDNCRWATRLQQNNNRRPRRWGKKPI
jgi:hypothetical protein